MPDGGFLPPLPGNKLPDCDSGIGGGCQKVTSIGAESGIEHKFRMPDGDFFLPLPGNKLPDIGGLIP